MRKAGLNFSIDRSRLDGALFWRSALVICYHVSSVEQRLSAIGCSSGPPPFLLWRDNTVRLLAIFDAAIAWNNVIRGDVAAQLSSPAWNASTHAHCESSRLTQWNRS